MGKRIWVTAWRREHLPRSLPPPRPRARARPAPRGRVHPGPRPSSRAPPQRRLLCMDGAAFWVMKYSQVSDSLRNDGDQSIPFSGSNFRSLCFTLTIIRMRRGARSKYLSAQHQPPPGGLDAGAWPRARPARTHLGWWVGDPARSQPGLGTGGWLVAPWGSCQPPSPLGTEHKWPPGHPGWGPVSRSRSHALSSNHSSAVPKLLILCTPRPPLRTMGYTGRRGLDGVADSPKTSAEVGTVPISSCLWKAPRCPAPCGPGSPCAPLVPPKPQPLPLPPPPTPYVSTAPGDVGLPVSEGGDVSGCSVEAGWAQHPCPQSDGGRAPPTAGSWAWVTPLGARPPPWALVFWFSL